MEAALVQVLVQTGPIGAVLGWFMLRLEARLRDYEAAQREQAEASDRLTRALMLSTLALNGIGPHMRRQVEDLQREAEQAIEVRRLSKSS